MAVETPSLHRWRRRIFRFGIWNLLYRFWMDMHIEGWENVPRSGPLIMMGNHIAAVDPVVIIYLFTDSDIVPMAKIEAWDQPVTRYFVHHWGAISVRRGELDLTALKTAIKQVEQGDVVMLYAEGTRSTTGLLQGQEGSVYLALKTEATIVPVAIWNTHDFPQAWWRDVQRHSIYLRFGQPFKFKQEGKRLPRDQFQAMTDEAMYRISHLLPAEWRGVYSDLSAATTNHLDFDLKWEPPSQDLPQRVTLSSDAVEQLLTAEPA
ncbi:MAG: 1-acyl-sn-glycerol-3-phosphate acyltransferase [Chloroflexi bacterium]|nr:1-acyl-sn-glycerol-3-phosphate acyltransferase [Chloroflexota bacterium]